MGCKTAQQLHKVFFRFLDLRYKSEHSILDVKECSVEVEQHTSDSDMMSSVPLIYPGAIVPCTLYLLNIGLLTGLYGAIDKWFMIVRVIFQRSAQEAPYIDAHSTAKYVNT